MTPSVRMTPDLENVIGLVEVAQGRIPADTYISGGRVLNVYSGEILSQNIAIHRGRIAYVGLQETMVGPGTKTIDATGYYLVPGYVNSHEHSDVVTTPTTHAQELLRRGTTTVFYNGRHVPFLLGPDEYLEMVKELSRLPVKLFFGIEAGLGAYDLVQGSPEDIDSVRALLSSDRIFGLHEVVRWTEVIGGDQTLLQKLQLTRERGKLVEGHAAGASYDKLNALAAAGFDSCHESINLQDVLNRLRLGLYVMLRCSSIRPDDLPDLLRVVTEQGLSSGRLILVPDGMMPPDTIEKGNMDYLVAGALEAGVDPATAYQMATLNPATHYGVDGDIGGIAPRRWADILFLRDIREPTPYRVMSNGEIVVDEGRLLIEFPKPSYYRLIRNRFATENPPAPLDPAVFQPRDEEGKPFPVMEMISGVINRRVDMTLPAENGLLISQPQEDILYIAMMPGTSRTITRGFIKGFGARVGGLAAVAGAGNELIVLGYDPQQMANAVRRVWELQGGMVIMDGGQSRFELPLPIGASMASDPVPVLARHVEEATRTVKEMGFPFKDLHYTMETFTWYFLPQLRLTAEGILDVRQGRVVVPSVPLP